MTRDELEALRQEIGAATRTEAKRILGVSDEFLLRIIREGKLRAITETGSNGRGGRVLVPFSAIREYLEGGKPLPRKGKAVKVPPLVPPV